LLAHFEPQNTNWIEQGEATAMPLHRCLSPWDGGRLAKVQQTKMITGLCLTATFRDYFVPSRQRKSRWPISPRPAQSAAARASRVKPPPKKRFAILQF
jgi:hypothetical protein